MTQWTKEEQRALRGRGLSRWLGSAGESLGFVLHMIALVVMLASELGMLVAFVGIIVSLLGIEMAWDPTQCAIGLVLSFVVWFSAAWVYEGTKR